MASIDGVNPPVLNDEDYVDKITDSFNAVDDHDHTTGKGVQIPAGGIADGAVTEAKLAAVPADAGKFLVRVAVTGAVDSAKTVPTGEVVGNSDSQTLTNKTIVAASNTITTAASGNLAATELNAALAELQSDIDTRLTASSSSVLTNKTIDADQNTISNIENADIKSGAAIAVNKLAAVTASRAVASDASGFLTASATTSTQLGYLSTTTSDVQTQLDGKVAKSTLTTKGDIYVATGASTVVRQGIGSDNQVLVSDSSQTNGLKWTTLQQGAKNYITYNNFENNAITGWNEMSVTWSSGLPSGAPTVSSSAASSITLAATSTNPLAGTYSMQMVGTISQGQGFCTDALTIDREDQAKVLQGSFYYEVASGASNANWSGTSSNTLAVYIYDITNSAWIQPAGVYNLVQSSGQGFCTFTFQAPASFASCRVCVVSANTASGSITVNFDDFYLGPQKVVYGAPITDWQSYTPTDGTWTGSRTTTGQWRRVGGDMELSISINIGGAMSGSLLTVSLPSGYTIDTAKIAGYVSGENYIGYGTVKAAGGSEGPMFVLASGTSAMRPVVFKSDSTYSGPNTGISATVPATFASGDFIRFTARVPISGWSANTVQSSDTDTRVVAARWTKVSQAVSNGATDILTGVTVVSDTHGGLNTTTGVYTVPVSGFYRISGAISSASTAYTTGSNRYVILWARGTYNTTLLLQPIWSTFTGYLGLSGSTTRYYNAGETISWAIENASGGTYTQSSTSVENYFQVERVSGPATIAASEKIRVRATTTSANTITTGSNATISWNGESFDTHGAFASNTFTAPRADFYKVKGVVSLQSATFVTGSRYTLDLMKGGVFQSVLGQFSWLGTATSASYAPVINFSDTIYLLAGETITIRATQTSGTDKSLDTSSGSNYWAIEAD